MIWLFERGNEAVRIETRKEVGEFVLAVYWHDGQCQVERFADDARFRTRLLALERQLAADQWQQIGNPRLSAGGGEFLSDFPTERKDSPD